MKNIRRYLVMGLIIWIPILATIYVIKILVNLLDQPLALLPAVYHLPGVGILISLGVLLFTGMLTSNYFGNKLLHWWDSILKRIPLVRTVYGAVKQVVETLFSQDSLSFRKVLFVQYPRQGIWSIAFQTGDYVKRMEDEEEMAPVFIPTTPNPTSGFLLFVPRKEVREIDMRVEDALKMVISLGVIKEK